MRDSAIVAGRIAPSGIVIKTPASLLSCCGRNRQELITYEQILAIEEHQSGHFLVKYVDSNSKPSRVAEKLIKIKESTNDARRNSFDEASLLDDEEGMALRNTETNSSNSSGSSIEKRVLQRAYSNSTLPSTRLPALVIINPKSGPGEAEHLYKERAAPVFAAAGLKTKVVVTKSSGEATRIAKEVAIADHDTLILVSGDGLPHEVINGLASRGEGSIIALKHFGICQLPGGSGNAMSLSLNGGEKDWAMLSLKILKGRAEPHDIMAVSQGDQTYYSFLSQSYGIVADCDLGTEHLRWMGGSRFVVGLVYKLLRNQTYPCEVAYKEGSAELLTEDGSLVPALRVSDPIPSDWIKENHPDLTMFYVGKMDWMSGDALMFPRAEPLDGSMDMIMWDTSFGSFNSLNALSAVEKGGHVPKIPFYKKIQSYRLTPTGKDEYLSIDGESYRPKALQVTVLRGAASFIRST